MLENPMVKGDYDNVPEDREDRIDEQIDLAYEQHVDRWLFAETR